MQLLREATGLQGWLPKIEIIKNMNLVSRKLCKYITTGNTNSAIELFSNNMERGVLSSNEETMDLLKVKHPVGKAASEDTKLPGPSSTFENIIFDVIGNSMVLETTKVTQGDSGPTAIDTDGWR